MSNTAFGHHMWGDLLGMIMIAWLISGVVLGSMWAGKVTDELGFGAFPLCLYIVFWLFALGPIWLLIIRESDFDKSPRRPEPTPQPRESSSERIERQWREADDTIPHSRYAPQPFGEER